MAVEYGQFWPIHQSPRIPQRLVITARVDWISAAAIHVTLPEVRVVMDGEAVILPSTRHKLDRFVHQMPWEQNGSEPGAPCEWKDQPFYPRVGGRWCTAATATYYNADAWRAYSHFFKAAPEPPRDIALERCARMLGIDTDAGRKEINAAFRVKVKKVHPDFGGTPLEFQQLLAARNTLLVRRQGT